MSIRLYEMYEAPDLADMEQLTRRQVRLLKSWPLLNMMICFGKYGSFRRRLMSHVTLSSPWGDWCVVTGLLHLILVSMLHPSWTAQDADG